MFFNLVHKPQPIGAKYYEAFMFQRKCAHDLGLKVTNFVASFDLTDESVISIAKEDMEKYGDDIGLLLYAKPGTGAMAWLQNAEDKRECVEYAVQKFKEAFGFAPKSISQYVLDSELIAIIKEVCPECIVGTAGCFEEGVKVFHGCNNSWYLFSEGMSWNPWYPSKDQSIRPAANADEWAGMVALPHLNRDLVLSYEGRNDFFASHPANIQRALANDGYTHDYDYNLLDSFRLQEDYNDGFSYYQINVSPGWLKNNINVIDDDEITRTLYRETLEYVKSLVDSGDIIDMTVSEFGEWYLKNKPIGKTEVAVAKDILYGSGKHYFWLFNPEYRVLVDTFQGGSIGDLRPYVGKYASYTGPHSPSLAMNSYPYVIQSQYRTGVKTHSSDGARTTLFVRHAGEEKDLCYYHSKVASVERDGDTTALTLNPVTVSFSDGLSLTIETVYRFLPGGRIEMTRRITDLTKPVDDLVLEEYVKGCYGFTEYPENMKDIDLTIDGEWVCDYCFTFKKFKSDTANEVSAIIPNISTEVALHGVSRRPDSVEVADGTLFSPYYTLRNTYKITDKKEITTCLHLKKA